MSCASCGFENPEGTKFCIECGIPLKNSCPSCGATKKVGSGLQT